MSIDYDEYFTLGGAYSAAVFACQGYVDYYFNIDAEGSYTKEEKAKIEAYRDDFLKKNPDTKLNKYGIYRKYADEHFEEFNTRKKLLRKGDDPVGDKERLDRARDIQNAVTITDYDALVKALSTGMIKKSDPKKLLEYNEKLKKDCPEYGMKGFKTNGVDDPFLILRMLDNFKLTDEEKKILNPDHPEQAKIYEWQTLVPQNK
jgi:hypothetical protein